MMSELILPNIKWFKKLFLKNSIPILLYHRIDYHNDRLSVTPEQFEEHLRIIRKLGFSSIFLNDLLYILEKGKIKSKNIVITFDDGHISQWVYAYPLLKKYSMKATFFVTTSWVSDKKAKRVSLEDVWRGSIKKRDLVEFLNSEIEKGNKCVCWAELAEMGVSNLVDVQSHGHRHIFIKNENLYTNDILLNLPKEEKVKKLKEEILTSKSMIEEKLKKKCLHFAWPGGGYSEEALSIIKKAGFMSISTIELGANECSVDRYKLRRITISNWFASPSRFLFFFWLFSNNFLKKLKRKFFRGLLWKKILTGK